MKATNKKRIKKRLLLAALVGYASWATPAAKAAEEAKAPAPAAPAAAAPAAPTPTQEIDISGLAEEYWRPGVDELEVIQSRRFKKAGRVELNVNYGFYQAEETIDATSYSVGLLYNFTEQFAVEVSTMKIKSEENAYTKFLQQNHQLTPDYNTEKTQHSVMAFWTPVYGKFSLVGKKISHFETFLGGGVGITHTADKHFTGHLSIGERFFITNNLLLKVEWKISRYNDTVYIKQGTNATHNGGSGSINQTETKRNLMVGLGWLF